jgi:hypothetical protein
MLHMLDHLQCSEYSQEPITRKDKHARQIIAEHCYVAEDFAEEQHTVNLL